MSGGDRVGSHPRTLPARAPQTPNRLACGGDGPAFPKPDRPRNPGVGTEPHLGCHEVNHTNAPNSVIYGQMGVSSGTVAAMTKPTYKLSVTYVAESESVSTLQAILAGLINNEPPLKLESAHIGRLFPFPPGLPEPPEPEEHPE